MAVNQAESPLCGYLWFRNAEQSKMSLRLPRGLTLTNGQIGPEKPEIEPERAWMRDGRRRDRRQCSPGGRWKYLQDKWRPSFNKVGSAA